MSRTFVIAASVLAAMTTGAFADKIDQREANQSARIEQGRRSGELTRHEVSILKAEQSRIESMEARARADGVVTRREAKAIEQAQDAASRHIYRESHDSERAGSRRN